MNTGLILTHINLLFPKFVYLLFMWFEMRLTLIIWHNASSDRRMRMLKMPWKWRSVFLWSLFGYAVCVDYLSEIRRMVRSKFRKKHVKFRILSDLYICFLYMQSWMCTLIYSPHFTNNSFELIALILASINKTCISIIYWVLQKLLLIGSDLEKYIY